MEVKFYKFKKIGIDWNDGSTNSIMLIRQAHQQIHKAYNKDWLDFFAGNTIHKISEKGAKDFMTQLMKGFW